MSRAAATPVKLTGITFNAVPPPALVVEVGVTVPDEVGVLETSSVVKGTLVTNDADGKAGGCVDKVGFGVKVVVTSP